MVTYGSWLGSINQLIPFGGRHIVYISNIHQTNTNYIQSSQSSKEQTTEVTEAIGASAVLFQGSLRCIGISWGKRCKHHLAGSFLQDGVPKLRSVCWFINPSNYSYSTGWWCTYLSEKYENQLGWLFPIYRKIKNIPNHQPEYLTR